MGLVFHVCELAFDLPEYHALPLKRLDQVQENPLD